MKEGGPFGPVFVLAMAATLLLPAAVVPGLSSLSAQQPDTVGEPDGGTGAPADSAAAADSTRVRVLRQLESLARPAGIDSVRLAQDSVARAMRTDSAQASLSSTTSSVGPRDSVATALRELTGYAITTYDGDQAEFEAAQRRLVLRGTEDARPRVAREGMSLSADSAIVYEEERERVRAVGRAEYTPQRGDPVASRTMVVDLGTQRGSALGARTRYDQGGTEWIVDGDLPSVESELVYGSSTSFTSCDLEEPHYHFEAGQVKIHQGNILVARPVRLYFADVPVAWLPFIAQSLAQGRASGLLTPRFSVNDIVRTSQGYSRRISNVGFYWAMSQYSDATLSMDWFSGQYTALTSLVRYRWARQFLNGSVNVRRFWAESGTRELAFDTRHQWEASERTRLSVDARYSTSTSFVRDNSFDPREVTQSIRSQGGLSHRFDWGSVNVGANSQQYLSDDGRVEMTLPSVGLSLSPLTFFQASPADASWYNNVTWNGSGNFSRKSRTYDVEQELDPETFDASKLDQFDTQASASSSFSLGSFSFSQSGSYGSTLRKGIPDFILNPVAEDGTGAQGAAVLAARTSAGLPSLDPQVIDLENEEVSWSSSASYQQRLIGSTTITPRIQVGSRAIRSDTLSVSSGYVSAPLRTSMGARLKTDVYGFFPGAGPFEQIRHKISPGISYDYSPEVIPTDLQRDVFGSGEVQTRSVVSLSLNQTFEAKLTPEASEDARARAAADSAAAAEAAADSLATAAEVGAEGIMEGGLGTQPGIQDPAGTDGGGVGGGGGSRGESRGLPSEGLERLDNGETLTLLALQTSAVTYDFVTADSVGTFIGGFQTTQLRNSIRSDYLRGLTIQTSHDLFADGSSGGGSSGNGGSNGDGGSTRRFAPHLSSVNLNFSLDSSSGIFRWLGLGGDDGTGPEAGDPEGEGPDAAPETDSLTSDAAEIDETSVVPGQSAAGQAGSSFGSGGVGRWSANVSYSLQRPRSAAVTGSQMLRLDMSFRPTEHWDVNWSTSYDVNRGGFNDHIIRLTRDLHRWQANFDFLQTATGNWSFRFSVSLLDNQDLEFDYEQRSPLDQP